MASSPPQVLLDFLKIHSNVEFINYHMIDVFGVPRLIVKPVSHVLQMASHNQALKLGERSMATPVPHGNEPWLYGVGADMHCPDWNTLCMFEKEGPHAAVFCHYSMERSQHQSMDPSNLFARCPRTVLAKTLEAAKSDHGLTMLVGVEIEFTMVPIQGSRLECLISNTNSISSAWTAESLRGRPNQCLTDCVQTLEHAGIGVEVYHACGQAHRFEISLVPLPPLQCVDATIQAQEIIKRLALKHNFYVSYHPNPTLAPTSLMNGLHVHLSLDQDCSEETESSFLAGILHRLPLLSAFSLAAPGSHARQVMFDSWVAYGTENRYCAIRKIEPRRWEIRCVDALCNYYLALAAYISAGLLGIEEKQELRWKDLDTRVEDLDVAGIEEYGVTTQIPADLKGKMQVLEARWMGLEKVMGGEILEFYRNCRMEYLKHVEERPEREVAEWWVRHF